LTDDLVVGYDPVFKVNPPLRTSKDVEALRIGLADGTIDVVATDHAPHPAEDKDCEWQGAAFGMLGLETALSVVATAMIDTKLMDWATLVERMSIAPARIAGYDSHGGTIAVGSAANLAVIDTSAVWQVDRNRLVSKSRNTPFHGMNVSAVVKRTIFKGLEVFSNGEVLNRGNL
jgi:dihydroorotase